MKAGGRQPRTGWPGIGPVLSGAVSALLAFAPAAARAQAPVALVIGNSAYAAQPKLPGCEASANLVSSTLSRAGVKVIRLDNPSNARLGTAVGALGDEVAAMPNSRALIYLCGYVASYSDRLFLVPVEARLDRETDVLSQGIVARLLMGSVVGPGVEAGLVLMDVAALPGQKGPPAFGSMMRPSDEAHGGLAVASLSAGTVADPAPLASALADLVGAGSLDIGAALRSLQAQPGIARALLAVQIPSQPSMLLGSAAPPVAPPVAPPPVAPPPVTPPPVAPPPVVAPVVVPPPAAPPPAAPPPAVSPPAPPLQPALAAPNAAERRRLQMALQRLGYFRGRINGTFGLDTLAAIRLFQKESDEEPTGHLTTKQAEQLLQ